MPNIISNSSNTVQTKHVANHLHALWNLSEKHRSKMGSISVPKKPHAVCIPYPAQGHINPMLKLAKLLHQKGFHITFVNTEYNHRRLLKSRGADSLNGVASFQFCTIPDGLPPTETDATQDIPSLCESTTKTCLGPFKDILNGINENPDVPPVSCIVSDGVMSFTVEAGSDLGIPVVLFWTASACGFYAYIHYQHLVNKGLIPLKGTFFFIRMNFSNFFYSICGLAL